MSESFPHRSQPIQTTYYQQLEQLSLEQLEAGVSAEWQVGDIILDLYEITGLLGEGGMGKVYRAHHRGWNIDLAVKCPKAETFTSQKGKELFIQEAETWVKLGLHPHIAACYYVRTLGGIPRLFAECVEGGSLESWIESGRLYEGGNKGGLERILDIAIQFAWGLGYAHEQGLVHQDVKPHNVLLTPEGVAKVTDFGLAKARELAGEVVSIQACSALSAGGFTTAYCSPEQYRRERLSQKSDIWSWAVSALEMFTGEVTWLAGQAAAEALERYLATSERRSDNYPSMPKGMVNLLRCCFQYDPNDRPRDTLSITKTLAEIYEQVIGKAHSRQMPQAMELRADSLNNQAISYLDLGKQKESEATWRKALEDDPQHLGSAFNLGYWQWQKAEITDDVLVSRMVEIESGQKSNPEYWHCLGWIHLERGDLEALDELQHSAHRVEIDGFIHALENLDKPKGRLLQIFKGFDGDSKACFSPDGHYAIFGGPSPLQKGIILRLCEMPGGREVKNLVIQSEGVDGISSLCFSPDGHFVLASTNDIFFRSWKIAEEREIKYFNGHTSFVRSVHFSPDGRFVLSGSDDKTLRLWWADSGKEIRKFLGHTGYVRSVCFSPDGCYGLSGSDDKTIRLWDLGEGGQYRKMEGHHGAVYTVCFSPDGHYALFGSADCTIVLWDISSGKEIRRFLGHTSYVTSACFSPDGRYVLSGSWDCSVRLWETSSGRALRRFAGHDIAVNSVCFSPDGRTALSAGQDKTIRLWEIHYPLMVMPMQHPFPLLSEIRTMGKLSMENEFVNEKLKSALVFIHANSIPQAYLLLRELQSIPGYKRDKEVIRLITLCGLRGMRTGLKDAWFLPFAENHKENISSICCSQDGSYVLSVSYDQVMRLWDLPRGIEVKSIMEPMEKLKAVSFFSDSRFALTGGFKAMTLWDLTNGTKVKKFVGHQESVNCVCFSPDGRFALSGSGGSAVGEDHTVRLWDVVSGQEIRRYHSHTEPIYSVCFSPDGRLFLSSSRDGTIQVWNINTTTIMRRFDVAAGGVRYACFSPDGRYILAVTGLLYGPVLLWDVASGKQSWQEEKNLEDVNPACFTNDGRYILCGNKDDTVALRDVFTGNEIRRFAGRVDHVCFSPDSHYAISAYENTVGRWEFDWEYKFPEPADWDEGARDILENFLIQHTPYAGEFPTNRQPTEEEINLALTRRGSPIWAEGDFQRLLYTLGCAGYGWLRPEGVGRKLEEMVKER